MLQVPARASVAAAPAADWYVQTTQTAAGTSAATTAVDQRAPPTVAPPSTLGPVVPGSSPYPSAFSRVDVHGRGDWQSLPDIDRRAPLPGPPSPVYSNASSTYFWPPPDHDWPPPTSASRRFRTTPPPNHFTGMSINHRLLHY